MVNKKKDTTKTQEKKPKEPELEREEESGGQDGPEPTRYGDWEKGGRCTDF